MATTYENKKADFIKSATSEDYKDYVTHFRIEDVVRVVEMNGYGSQVKPIKIKDLDGIYFMNGKSLVIDWKAKYNGDGSFTLQEMTLQAYNKFEASLT